jgi:predicted AAA+ superfamily ATPase
MDNRFLLHNAHLTNAAQFAKLDPQLRKLHSLKYISEPKLLKQLPVDMPGIYTLTGGRQVGKTTLLKQWMNKLLQQGIPSRAIAFFTGEIINDHHSLIHILQQQLTENSALKFNYIILDEVTYIKHWDKAIKFLADAGLLEQTILVLTGSDALVIQEARMRFPGRRGKAAVNNFHLAPLSFKEDLELKAVPDDIDAIYLEFNNYLQHGGYLVAINDLAMHKRILPATLATYSDWIRGDVLRRGKQEQYLREILMAIIKRYNSQITWNVLSRDLSIDHPKTVADYSELLASMDVLFIQSALLEDKLTAAPKKAKKVVFQDPFIFHAIRAWLWPTLDPYNEQIKPALKDTELCSKLVEACTITHYARIYPTYYIKAEGEVDIAYIENNKFWPVEVKWTQQTRPKDLKQVLKYSNSIILTKSKEVKEINGIKSLPLPPALP